MKTFLSTVKGKVIAGAITLAVIAAVIIIVVLLNTGYRTITVDDLNGTTTITAGVSVSEAFKGQNLKSGSSVAVGEKSDLTLALDTDKHVYAKELTKFSLEAFGTAGKDSKTVINLEEGSVLNEIDVKLLENESYTVDSPNALMAVRGTTFTVAVSFDEEGLCHTLVEVEEGAVEVTKKDENGEPNGEVQSLEAGGKTEVISLIQSDDDEPASSNTTNSPNSTTTPSSTTTSNNTTTTLPKEVVYQDQDAIAVENAIEAYLNGSALDTTNFDRVTNLDIYACVAFVILDDEFGGKGKSDFQSKDFDGNIEVYYKNEHNESVSIISKYNNLTDLNFLTEMKKLKALGCHYGKVSDITAIGQLSELKYLSFNENEIADISPLENLTKLINLTICNSQISDISSLKELKQLEHLFISNSNISDISPISELKNLRTLVLDYNNISDISPISELKNLYSLTLNGNDNISDISSLKELKQLESLSIMSNNNISDFSPISELKNLHSLSLHGNNLSDLSPISGLTNITSLLISRTNISDISPIANLKKLSYLMIDGCPINDYSPLYGLTDLTIINCYGISGDEKAKLQQALPNATIYG